MNINNIFMFFLMIGIYNIKFVQLSHTEIRINDSSKNTISASCH
jgi:hypothetical protein